MTATETVPHQPAVQASSQSGKQAIVVGASSGMGAELVRQLAADGYRVAALARRQPELERLAQECAPAAEASGGAVLVRSHDVSDTDGVARLWEELVRELGGCDLLVYAAGIMTKIEANEYDTRKDLKILEINTAGCMAWCNAAAQFFASQRSGTIVGISSVAGDRGRKGNPAYCTSKAAMNTYLEALRNRLGAFGVHVCTIRPGYVDTVMTEDIQGSFVMPILPVGDAARSILSAARKRRNVSYVPGRWRWIMLVIRSIPSVVFRRLNV